jgi:PPK2 family polyphosphate:nucleotide phosphotransferase
MGRSDADDLPRSIVVAAAPERHVRDPSPEPRYPTYRVRPGKPLHIADVDPDESEHYRSKDEVRPLLAEQRERIADLQARLFAEGRRGLLIVLQAMDAGGKDGAIKGVFRGVNPQGCMVWSFKVPTEEDMAHDFLWRYHRRAPERGKITIFNRSHYEDVLVPRVKRTVGEDVWRARHHVIRDFEHALAHDEIGIVKFFLHISRKEQKRRLERRLQDPRKRWKFNVADLEERVLWDDYQAAYEDAINETSTAYAPWYVVPANRKWYRNLVVARTIADTLEAMDPQYPRPQLDLSRIEIPD